MRNKPTKTIMKTMNTLLLAGAVALGFTLTTTAIADEPLLSPKAAALRHDFRKVLSTDTSPNLISNSYLGAAAKTEFNRARVVTTDTVTPNLVSASYAGAALKNPYPPSTRFDGTTCELSCCAKK